MRIPVPDNSNLIFIGSYKSTLSSGNIYWDLQTSLAVIHQKSKEGSIFFSDYGLEAISNTLQTYCGYDANLTGLSIHLTSYSSAEQIMCPIQNTKEFCETTSWQDVFHKGVVIRIEIPDNRMNKRKRIHSMFDNAGRLKNIRYIE
jgi:hypothetical protein